MGPNDSSVFWGCVRHGQHEAVDILLRRGAQLHTELGGKTPVVLCLEVSEDDGDVCVCRICTLKYAWMEEMCRNCALIYVYV